MCQRRKTQSSFEDFGKKGAVQLSKEIEKNREAGYRLGMLSKDPSSDVLVIDLNRQTLISKEYSFLDSVLDAFCDPMKWQICRECERNGICPILRNSDYWAEEETPESKRRRKGLEYIISVLECCDVVITKRNLLEIVSWMFTGNLDCKRFQRWMRRELNSRRYLSHQLIYENEWIDYGFRQLPIIKEFRRFDPGMNSDLLRDEQLDRRNSRI